MPRSVSSMPSFPYAGPVDRREWLRIGGLSLGALASSAVPSLSTLLSAAESQTPGTDSQFSVILFWANGGPSHIDLFDMKPNAPSEYRGPFQPIATNVAGMEINELLPSLAGAAWVLDALPMETTAAMMVRSEVLSIWVSPFRPVIGA